MEGINIGRIDLAKGDITGILNELESQIMDCLWTHGHAGATARDIYGCIKRKDLANTTIVVTLDRLHKKGLVEREVARGRGGMYYIYRPRFTRQAFGERLALMFAQSMLNTFGDSMAAFFSEEAMRRLINERRKKR